MKVNVGTVHINQIKINGRHRKDPGKDIEGLMASIREVGLLHPIVVDSNHNLIAGERRLEAFKRLHAENGTSDYMYIPTLIAKNLDDVVLALKAERDENTSRLAFSPTEAYELTRAIKTFEEAESKERHDKQAKKNLRITDEANFAPTDVGKTRDKVAEVVGMSGWNLEKIETVMEAAATEPEEYGDLPEVMDKKSVDKAYKELKKRKRQGEVKEAAKKYTGLENIELIHGDIKEKLKDIPDESIDLILTDPPYGSDYLDLYSILAKESCRILKPGCSLLILTGQSYLPEILNRVAEHMSYHWTLAYLTPGGQSPTAPLASRKVNSFWKPVLWFVKGDYAGEVVGDVVKSDVNDNDKEHHRWGQSESGFIRLIEKFTLPGQTILDPFLGGGTTAVTAKKLSRNFIGIDINESCLIETKARLVEVSSDSTSI